MAIVSRQGPGAYPKEKYGSFSGKPVFVSNINIINTAILQLPINCMLAEDGIIDKERPWAEAHEPNYKMSAGNVSAGAGGRLSANESTFTVTTTKRGYD